MLKSIIVKGRIEFVDIGIGTWTVKTDNSEIYEIIDIPEQIKTNGLTVTLWIEPLEDYVSMNMLGIPARVNGFSY